MTDRVLRNRPLLRWALLGAALLGLTLTLAKLMPRSTLPVAAPAIQASMTLASGEVFVDTGHGPARVGPGAPLPPASRVVTGRGARAQIRLADGTSLFVRDATELMLEGDGVRLLRGEYWLDAPPVERASLVHHAGEVAVSAADAGLSLSLQGDRVGVYVASGTASVVAAGGRAEVHAGERADVQGKAAPRVTPVAFWEDWTGGLADFAAGRRDALGGGGTLYGVDAGASAGTRTRRLELMKEVVRARLREGISETEIEQTFFNPGARDVEGWYWFTVPERASVTGFAVETNGKLVWGELIERKEAAQRYEEAKATAHAPALLEWIDARTYRARIFPVQSGKSRRVAIRYMELEPMTEGRLEYVFPLLEPNPTRIGDFSLTVDLGEAGATMKLATLADARIEDGGRRVTLRRSGYTPRADFRLLAELPKATRPLSVARFRTPDGDAPDYLMVRYVPDVDFASVSPAPAHLVVVVDTSAAGDEAARQLATTTAEALLRGLSPEDRFALIALDAAPTVLHPKSGLAPASDSEVARALAALAGHPSGGATDLSASFDTALARVHGSEQPAVVYVGDGVATTGAMAAETLKDRLKRALSTSRARLFTVGVGTNANQALLADLARTAGGHSYHVDHPEEAAAQALLLTAAVKTPTLTDFELDLGAGLDEVFSSVSGKVSRGDEALVLARSHHELPPRITVRGRLRGEAFEKQYDATPAAGVLSPYVPRFWAAEYVRRLLAQSREPDAEHGRIVALGLEYGLMTPFTSILALESESAYGELGIVRRRSPLRPGPLSSLQPIDERRLIDRALPSVPGVMFGCSRTEREEASASPPATEEPTEKLAKQAAPVARDAPFGMSDADVRVPAQPVQEDAAGVTGGAAAPAALAKGRPLAAAARSPAPQSAPDARRRSLVIAPEGRDDTAEPKRGHTGQAEPSELRVCSDAAERPLGQRVLLWYRRLLAARVPSELISRYEDARSACELPDWLAERTFLFFLAQRLNDPDSVRAVLGHFAHRREVQQHLAKLVLRRAIHPALAEAVHAALFGDGINWTEVDLALSAIAKPEERLTKLRQLTARSPEDPNGALRMMRLLVATQRVDEALAVGRKLQETGFVTPLVAQQLGDVLARAGKTQEAVRTYSEIVEFDPDNHDARRLLGDIYMAHAWYEPAYRQYRTLTEAAPEDAVVWLRLAAAAAGAGRVDEALRLERKVAAAEGRPGPMDPRRWARIMSAQRLGELLASTPASGAEAERRRASLERELRELQLFETPGSLIILAWEDFSRDVTLVARDAEREVTVGEAVRASGVGLMATFVPLTERARLSFGAHLTSEPNEEALRLKRYEVRWDGRGFQVQSGASEIPAWNRDAVL
jgi:tetratricopeptide (TPR) repeat protein